MPNVKIFVDDSLYPALRAQVMATLGPLRDLLCARFEVDIPACQFAVVPVGAMPDLPRLNVEMAILPRTDRTRRARRGTAGDPEAPAGEGRDHSAAVRRTEEGPAVDRRR